MTIPLIRLLWLFALFAPLSPALAEQPVAGSEFKITEVRAGLYMLQGKGGNVALSVGADGMLMVDDDYAEMSPALAKAVDSLGGNLKFVLNTHWHRDHTGGNAGVGKQATLVAHSSVRKRLMTRQEISHFKMVQEPQPEAALPVITVDDSLSFHFNGQEIAVRHYPGGHTDGDLVVYFTGSKVVHMGDHYFAGMFPFVDIDSGGNVLRMAENVAAIIETLPADVKVIPGHGPLSDLQALKDYHAMLVGTTAQVRAARDAGKTLEQIQADGLPDTWQAWTDGFIDTPSWIAFIYRSL
jgi:glyoxylase-like metal-dependent hydrolase (beta-lactamase superfamily II)